jgi:hypothetical protein
MANIEWTTPSIPYVDVKFNGGLNSTSSPLNLQETESSDLQNIDFDRFGSVLKRNGYICLNTDSAASLACNGLYWFVYNLVGVTTRKAVRVFNSKIEKMDDLDGTWDDITGGVTIGSSNHCDFATFNNKMFITDTINLPISVAAAGTAGAAGVPANLTRVKYICPFQNYLFYGNVLVNGVYYPTRVYWSNIRDDTTWDAANWVEVSKDDGQEITGMKVLSNGLVIFKSHSIYNIFFTGDANVPFIMQKSGSAVGCVSFSSIQEVQGGLVFLSHDGFYYYDGTNSQKISDRITKTISEYNTTFFRQTRSLVQYNKNRVWWSFVTGGNTTADRVIVWDYYNNAWSVYTGIYASAMHSFNVDGVDERPYFSDYTGRVYRADFGLDDYPANTATAISAYYWTNWKHFGDAVNQKGIPHIYVYYEINNATMSFSYAYNFESGETYTRTFRTYEATSLWDRARWDSSLWVGGGGAIQRLDLTGRGRVVRFRFANATLSETFKIDAIGAWIHLETHV